MFSLAAAASWHTVPSSTALGSGPHLFAQFALAIERHGLHLNDRLRQGASVPRNILHRSEYAQSNQGCFFRSRSVCTNEGCI